MPEATDPRTPRVPQLADFQARFIEDFLRSGAPKYCQLVAQPGMGKAFTSAHLISRLYREGARRVLVLSPAAMVSAWHQQIKDFATERPVLVVDRGRFLELQSESRSRECLWPEGTIIASIDLAKRDDVALSLVEAAWDLVIVDEAHNVTGQRRQLVEKLMDNDRVPRLLLLTAPPASGGEPYNVQAPISTVSWEADFSRWRDLRRPGVGIDHRVVLYNRGDDEIAFLKALDAFLQELPASRATAFTQRMILDVAASCAFNVEDTLLRIRRGLDARSLVADLLRDPESAGDEMPEPGQFWQSIPDCGTKTERLLQLLENVTTDAKLTALRAALGGSAPQGLGRHTVVMSSFASTVRYVSAAIGEYGSSSFLITDDAVLDERKEVLRDFRERGGILVAADAAIAGADLGFTDVVIHYDLPSCAERFQIRRGSYDTTGRTTSCFVYAFSDNSGVLPFESERLKKLGMSAH